MIRHLLTLHRLLLTGVLALLVTTCSLQVEQPLDTEGTQAAPAAAPQTGPVLPDEPELLPEPSDDAGTDEAEEALPVTEPPMAMRAAWVHLFDDALKSRESIHRVVDELAAAGANTVIAQVARRHDAYYASDVLPRTVDPSLEAGLDVLDELLTAAHAAGLEVHAWVAVAPTAHAVYDGVNMPSEWVPTAHGPQAPEDQRWVTRSVDGSWSDYLDLGVPQVHDHMAAVATELASRYPIDGFHLDYVRYDGADFGYHPQALARYQADTGVTEVPDPDDAQWSAWRREQTRALVERVGAALDATGRDVTLSAATISWGSGPVTADGEPREGGFTESRAYTETFQDWAGWARDGLVDVVLPMNYFRDHVEQEATWFVEWLQFQNALVAESEARIVPGIAGYLNTPEAAAWQIATALRATGGAAMYSYQQPTEDGSRDIWAALAEADWGYSDED